VRDVEVHVRHLEGVGALVGPILELDRAVGHLEDGLLVGLLSRDLLDGAVEGPVDHALLSLACPSDADLHLLVAQGPGRAL